MRGLLHTFRIKSASLLSAAANETERPSSDGCSPLLAWPRFSPPPRPRPPPCAAPHWTCGCGAPPPLSAASCGIANCRHHGEDLDESDICPAMRQFTERHEYNASWRDEYQAEDSQTHSAPAFSHHRRNAASKASSDTPGWYTPPSKPGPLLPLKSDAARAASYCARRPVSRRTCTSRSQKSCAANARASPLYDTIFRPAPRRRAENLPQPASQLGR